MKNLLGLFVLPLLVLAAHAKLSVVVTTPDLASIAREIGGDQIELTALARPTEDPHFVDAKPSFIVRLNKADALLEGGAELEIGWLPPLLQGARNPKIQSGTPGYVLCHEGITMLEIPATLDRSKGDVHASGNPHYMTDPANAKIVAKHIASAFCQLDPKSCDVFKANLKSFEDRLDAKIVEWKMLLAPHKGKEVVTYHNYWIYFAKAFDLKMDLYLEPKPGIPPTSAHLAEVIAKMRSDNIRLIVVQPYQNRKTAETVASHTGGAVLDWPSFPMTNKETQSYMDWMDFLVKSLAKSFEEKK
ncbi:MAG: zinc ABC transporter substrate-binding protein [Verrucomicrobia bacterium]|nr:MAG: zinc ABC transporter substrate-binding protein [Verrucomicrobiota bacterium]